MPAASAPPCALPGSPLERASEGLEHCVHCGFCLQACPTYLALDDENDSPRGRLVLMQALLRGELSPTDVTVTRHFDRCLGCRGCESACPSGVPYGHLIEATRTTLAAYQPLQPLVRLLLMVFARRWVFRPLLAMARLLRATRLPALLGKLPPPLGTPFGMLEASRPILSTDDYKPTATDHATRVAVFRGCVMDGLFPHTNAATARVLTVNGYRCLDVRHQTCCGALHAHAGAADAARDLARRNIAAFETSRAEFIVSNAAGCGAMMREYGQLLDGDAGWHERARAFSQRVRDVTELLAARGPAVGASLPHVVALDLPCHLQHAQRIVDPPGKVLTAIPSLSLVPLVDADQCCGAAGIYSLVQPETSELVLNAKLGHITATSCDLIATGNPGCLMQIGGGLHARGDRRRAVHPVDLLDASYARMMQSPPAPASADAH